MATFFGDKTPALWLPERAFLHFDRLSKKLTIFIPTWFIFLKVFDYWLGTKPIHDWWWYAAAGLFAKIDDISFWIVVAGLLAARNVMKAWFSLPQLASGVSESATSGDLRRTAAFTIAVWMVYLGIMYPTNGTFFVPFPKEERAAQILEGLTNLGLASAFLVYFLLGIITLRRASALKKAGFDCNRLLQCARLLANAPLSFVIAVVAGVFFFPAIQWGAQYLNSHTAVTWWNWAMFHPHPFKEVLGGAIGGCFLVVLYFLPWFWFIRPARRLLCDHCSLKINWFVLIPLIALQQGIPALLILLWREIKQSKGDFQFALLVECKEDSTK
jgi:hypothetical protein